MADKVKLSKDGNSIDFVQSESIPTSVKKFRQSPEIEGFYRFIFENDLQKEAFEILEKIVQTRKAKKLKDKQDAQPAKKAEAAAKKEIQNKKMMNPEPPVAEAKSTSAKVPVKTKAIPVSSKKSQEVKKPVHSKKK